MIIYMFSDHLISKLLVFIQMVINKFHWILRQFCSPEEYKIYIFIKIYLVL